MCCVLWDAPSSDLGHTHYAVAQPLKRMQQKPIQLPSKFETLQ